MRFDTSNLVEIVLFDLTDFLKIRETLTRIGVPSRDNKRLYQSCHILHKRSKYYLVHFKELFLLDGKPTEFTETDLARRNSIINYLLSFKYFALESGETELTPHLIPPGDFKVITYRDKGNWNCIPKYTIGSPRNFKRPESRLSIPVGAFAPTTT